MSKKFTSFRFCKILFLLTLILFLSNCSHTKQAVPVVEKVVEKPVEKKYPTNLMWMRHSVEVQALAQQVYKQAWQAVKAKSKTVEGDWVVVLDVDETVLDNSRHQEVLFEKNESYPFYWDDWVREEVAPPIPGAKAFLDSVRSLGENAHIAFITNRKIHLEEATRRNMMKEGMLEKDDILLCQIDRKDTKEIRRTEVRTGTGRCDGLGTKTIIALIGDQVFDMEEPPATVSSVEEIKAYFLNHPEWGKSYFMLPNPIYGYWERAYNFN